MAKTKLFTIEKCYVTIPSMGRVPVIGFSLTTEHNGVPSLRVVVDAFHLFEEPTIGDYISGAKKPKAREGSLDSMTKRYLKLQEIVVSDARKCDFYFKIILPS